MYSGWPVNGLTTNRVSNSRNRCRPPKHYWRLLLRIVAKYLEPVDHCSRDSACCHAPIHRLFSNEAICFVVAYLPCNHRGSLTPMRGCTPCWRVRLINSTALPAPCTAASTTAPGSPAIVTTERLWSASIDQSNKWTPSTRMAAMIASGTAASVCAFRKVRNALDDRPAHLYLPSYRSRATRSSWFDVPGSQLPTRHPGLRVQLLRP